MTHICPDANYVSFADDECKPNECICEDCSVAVEELGEFEVTYYCDNGFTASGTEVHQGTCAADPSVIPMGSTIYIEYDDGSIRECTVEDTGGAIKGNILDVWLPSEEQCIEEGRDKAKVYLEKEN